MRGWGEVTGGVWRTRRPSSFQSAFKPAIRRRRRLWRFGGALRSRRAALRAGPAAKHPSKSVSAPGGRSLMFHQREYQLVLPSPEPSTSCS